jgi:CRISPR-associated protein Cmr1
MARHPRIAAPSALPQIQAGDIVEVRSYRLITPLLGGGAKVKHPDSQTVVRPSAIRGILRFWWRAMRGGQSGGDVQRLKRREAQVWGGRVGNDMFPSKVRIAVKNASRGSAVKTDSDIRLSSTEEIDHPNSKLSYALFILRAINNQKQEYDVRSDVTFDLEVSYPRDDEQLVLDVRAAIWAWEQFGGVGARTRRGLGAVHLESVNGKKISRPQFNQLAEYIDDQLKVFQVGGQWPVGTPSLQGLTVNQYNPHGASVAIIGPNKESISVWEQLLGRYRNFRQERFMRNRNGKYVPYGSSVWPDANGLRSTFGVGRHPQSDYGEQSHAARAQLGLPMVIQFMRDKFDVGGQNNVVQFIVENEVGRHASPAIFRPLRVDGEYAGVLLILGNSRIATDVTVKGNDEATRRRYQGVKSIKTRGNTDIRNRGDNQGELRQPHGPTNTTDVLQGLFNYMKKN